MDELQEYLNAMLAHLDDMAKRTLFLMGMERGKVEAQAQTSGGKYSTQTEEKMLIDMKGISINATPRKDGRFQGYVLRDGEKQYFYGKTRKDVQAKIQAYLQTTPTPKRKKRKTDTSPLFADFCENWIEKYKAPNLKPKSLESLKFALKRAKEKFGDRTLASITTDDLQAFFAAMPPSRSRDLCAVHVGQLFKKAYALGVIKRNPFENVEIKKHAPQKRSALTVEEQTAFLQAAKSSSYFLLFRTLLATGLRIGEALALSPADIQDGKITVSKDIVFVGGKKIIQPPKSKAAFRSVPIPEDVYKALAQISTERIFSVSYNTVRLAFRRVSQKLGFPVTPHILRHTYATRLEEAGIPPKIKQYLMGHASLHMTQDTYTDAQTAYIETANDSVRAVFDTK